MIILARLLSIENQYYVEMDQGRGKHSICVNCKSSQAS